MTTDEITQINTATSMQLFGRASRVIPGGVDSPVRAMRSVGRDYPIFIAKGQGAFVWDADDNKYVDWVQSWGALPLGHADEDVVFAVTDAMSRGSSFGAPTRSEVELAELICSAIKSVEQVRFVSSGTEATMSALRLARAATGRTNVVTFSGCYHGHSDAFLATGGSGLATLSIPSTPGVPEQVTGSTLLARYNDSNSVEACFNLVDNDVAAIFVEPIAGNMGVVPANSEFLHFLRDICDRTGALLVFDEVISGFRAGWGGAQEAYGVAPDLTCLGKAIGGGLPVGAFGGRVDLMQMIAPAGDVYQAGTLSGNPLAMAAGLATLTALRDRDAYSLLETLGARLENGLKAAITETGANAAVTRSGSLLTLFHLGENLTEPPRNFDEAKSLDTEAFGATHAACVQAGHLLPPSQFEALFISAAHTEQEIDELVAAVTDSWKTA